MREERREGGERMEERREEGEGREGAEEIRGEKRLCL